MVELLKDYDISILYHLDKANMMTYALSENASNMGGLIFLRVEERPLALEV